MVGVTEDFRSIPVLHQRLSDQPCAREKVLASGYSNIEDVERKSYDEYLNILTMVFKNDNLNGMQNIH